MRGWNIYHCDFVFLVSVLCKLIRGEFPVTHSSDYVNRLDTKAFPVHKPNLSGNISKRIFLKVTVIIDTQEMFVTIRRSASSIYFEVIYSGIEFPSSHLQKKYLKYFSDLQLNEIFIDPWDELKSGFSSPSLASSGMLWLNTDSTLSESFYTDFASHLTVQSLSVSLVITRLCSSILAAFMNRGISVNSFCVLPLNQPSLKIIADATNLLERFIEFHSKHLKYLHLNSCFFSMLPLHSLQNCINLRVLNITMNLTMSDYYKRSATTIQIFECLQHLICLEYLEWSEPLNLVTRDALALFNLLSNYLPRLVHWHWKLNNLLLFTTDLDNPDFKPLEGFLTTLLEGKFASPWCSTYKFDIDNIHFRSWLESIRPQTCFHFVSFPRNSQLRFSEL